MEPNEDLDLKGKVQVHCRILKIQTDGYFGDAKDLGQGLAELRWKNGRRVRSGRPPHFQGGPTIERSMQISRTPLFEESLITA